MRNIFLLLLIPLFIASPLAGAGKVLIYGPTMIAQTPNEQSLAAAAGFAVTVADAPTWSSMTTAQFSSFNAIVLGDPACGFDPSILDTVAATQTLWASAATGPKIIIGTDPIFHSSTGQAQQLITNGIKFAASGPGTGLYASLSCYYALSGGTVAFLSSLGSFQVAGQNGCPNSAGIVSPAHPAMAGLTNSGLSGWGCSMHEWFTSFPSSYTVLVTETSGTPASRPYIIASGGGPAIQITLIPPPTNDTYVIDDTPTMPQIQAQATIINVSPDPTPTTTFTWTATLVFKPPCGSTADYSRTIVQNSTMTGGGTFTLTFTKPSAFRGGSLQLTAAATVNGKQLKGMSPSDLTIKGTNPQRSAIQLYSDSLVPSTGFNGLQVQDIQDVLKRIACRESNQEEFAATADGGIGPAKVSCDRGVGVFQLTSGDPLTTTPDVAFNWKANTAGGESHYQGDAQHAKQYPSNLSSSSAYHTFIDGINQTRIANGLKPLPGFPAPQFTTSGVIGSSPPNQLLEDAVRGYNGWAGSPPFNPSGVLHEFIPDKDFLVTVPDSELPGLHINPAVWRRVLPAERPQCSTCGDASYFDHVKVQSPQCGG